MFNWAANSPGQSSRIFAWRTDSEAAGPICVALSKNELSRKYSRIFGLGLRKLKENGRFDAFLSSYGFTKQ
jgi:hypothetical protein